MNETYGSSTVTLVTSLPYVNYTWSSISLGVFEEKAMLVNDTSGPDVNATGAESKAPVQTLLAMPEIPGWLSCLYLGMLCLSILLGVPGNTVTVAAYAGIKVKTSCDWYILFVALTDLVSCVCRSPVYIMEHYGVWSRYSNSDLCKVIAWISQTTVCVSIFLFALIAIDRYFKLCSSQRYSLSARQSRNTSLVLMCLNLVLAAPCLLLFQNNHRGVCQIGQVTMRSVLVKAYYSVIFALFLVMMVAVVFCYICIVHMVRKNRRVFHEATNPSYNARADVTPSSCSGNLSECQEQRVELSAKPTHLTVNVNQDRLAVDLELNPSRYPLNPEIKHSLQDDNSCQNLTGAIPLDHVYLRCKMVHLKPLTDREDIMGSWCNTRGPTFQGSRFSFTHPSKVIVNKVTLETEYRSRAPQIRSDTANIASRDLSSGDKARLAGGSEPCVRGRKSDRNNTSNAQTCQASDDLNPHPEDSNHLRDLSDSGKNLVFRNDPKLAHSEERTETSTVKITKSTASLDAPSNIENVRDLTEDFGISSHMEYRGQMSSTWAGERRVTHSLGKSISFSTDEPGTDQDEITFGKGKVISTDSRIPETTMESPEVARGSNMISKTSDQQTGLRKLTRNIDSKLSEGRPRSSTSRPVNDSRHVDTHGSASIHSARGVPDCDVIGALVDQENQRGREENEGMGSFTVNAPETRDELEGECEHSSGRDRVPNNKTGMPLDCTLRKKDITKSTSIGENQTKKRVKSTKAVTIMETQRASPRHQRNLEMTTQRQQRNIRITGLLFVVTVVYILSWVPPYISMVKGFFIGYGRTMGTYELSMLTYGPSVYVLNTFANPVIYAALSATYRRNVMNLVREVKGTVFRGW